MGIRHVIAGIILLSIFSANNLLAGEDKTPPVIEVLAPLRELVTNPGVESSTAGNIIYGRVSPDAIKLTINNIAAEIFDQDKFIARPALTKGKNTVTLTAEDASGNSSSTTLNFNYQPNLNKIKIIAPEDNDTMEISPIKVSGKAAAGMERIIVNYSIGEENSEGFIAERVRLSPVKSIITVQAKDKDNNIYTDSILVNTPELKHYELRQISADIGGLDENRPVAGENTDLIAKLIINNEPAAGKEIIFSITQGKGSIPQATYITDINGEVIVPFTTDKDAGIINKIKAEAKDNPEVNMDFDVFTQPGQAAKLTAINGTESLYALPNAGLDIGVKLTDANNNPISDKEIRFAIMRGRGRIKNSTAMTTRGGIATTEYTAGRAPNKIETIRAYVAEDPSISQTFRIKIAATNMDVDRIMQKVKQNDEKIKDITADIDVTTNATWSAPQLKLKIWQKGDKQKVEQIEPVAQVKIRPALEPSAKYIQMKREIISYNPAQNIYVIKSMMSDQTEEYPHQIDYVDYRKGVVLKTEYYSKTDDEVGFYAIEDSDFIKISGVWVFQKETKTFYAGTAEPILSTISSYTNIRVNKGISDEVFK